MVGGLRWLTVDRLIGFLSLPVSGMDRRGNAVHLSPLVVLVIVPLIVFDTVGSALFCVFDRA